MDSGASMYSRDTTFRENSGLKGGGGLSCTSCPTLQVTGGAFSTNSAANGGGGGVACATLASFLISHESLPQLSSPCATGDRRSFQICATAYARHSLLHA